MPKCPECGCRIDSVSELENKWHPIDDQAVMYYCPECEAILGFA